MKTAPIHQMSYDQLAARSTEIADELQALSGHDNLTTAQETRMAELITESRHLDLRSLQLNVEDGHVEGGAVGTRGLPGHDDPGFHPANTGVSRDMFGNVTATRDQAARTIDTAHGSGLIADHAAERATRLIDQGMPRDRSLAARWAVAAGDPAYLTAFAKLVADPVRGHLLFEGRELEAYQAVAQVQSELRAMSLTDGAGGFMVPFTLDPAINITSAGSTNPLRRIARIEQTLGDQWSGITSAGVVAEWKAEAAQAADASPTLANPSVPVFLGDAYVPFSFEVGMDGASFMIELQTLLVDALDQLQATAYTTGPGTTAPKGFVTGLAGTASEVNAAADDTFARADVYALQNALPARFSPNASWQAALPIINLMSQFETTAGARLFPEISEGRLLNRPLHENSNMDSTITTSGAVSNFVLAYGDWRQAFVIVDRIGAQLELIQNVVGANGRPTGQRGAFLWARTGSDVLVTNAARLLDVASAA
ncbi:phage major capsid protein [Nocardioides speluncae]|uniref:phage major capsid protein n=1 Tax=Nocardioides speluncae TaxID=2670337 RepID=UPI0019807EB9|nr:phage major capsid protein [Nocardioides speluncae]